MNNKSRITRSQYIIMYSCQDTADFYCDELTMNFNGENCWTYDQNQSPSNDQVLLDVKTADDCNSLLSSTVCALDHTYALESASIQQSVPANYFTDGSFSQHNPVQYTPLTPDPVPSPVFYPPSQKLHSNFMAKRHYAQIIAPTRNGSFKTIVKRKRKRTVFTTEQLQSLEDIFKTKQYITREERQVIVNQLQLNDKAVKIWFQNRRLKDKKAQEETEEEYGIEDFNERSSRRDIARLEYVESLINNKTDEFGYVTLDDIVMKNLYGVINDFLINDKASDGEDSTESGSSPIYEPISPASASDSNDEENNSTWKPSEPNEALQRLFDLQSMLSL